MIHKNIVFASNLPTITTVTITASAPSFEASSDLQFSGSFTESSSGNHSDSLSGSVSNSGSITSFSAFKRTSSRVYSIFNDMTSSNYTSVSVGFFYIVSSDTVSSLPGQGAVYLITHIPSGNSVYSDTSGYGGTILIPATYTIGSNSDSNQSLSGSGTYSGSSSGTFSGSITGIEGDRSSYMRIVINFSSYLDPGEYYLGTLLQFPSSPVVSDYPLFSKKVISHTRNLYMFNQGDVLINTNNRSSLSASFRVFSRVNSLAFFVFFDVPSYQFFNPPIGDCSVLNQVLSLSNTQTIIDDLQSSGGANSSANSAIENMGSEFQQYQDQTDTSIQYTNIGDDLFNLNTSVFLQLAPTISLFSSCITLTWNSLGDFSTALTVFLVVVLMSCILGLIRYVSSSGSNQQDKGG